MELEIYLEKHFPPEISKIIIREMYFQTIIDAISKYKPNTEEYFAEIRDLRILIKSNQKYFNANRIEKYFKNRNQSLVAMWLTQSLKPNQGMYQKYLEEYSGIMKDLQKEDSPVVKYYESYSEPVDFYVIGNFVFRHWLDSEEYNIESCMISDFPREILEPYLDNEINLTTLNNIRSEELIKWLYLNWPEEREYAKKIKQYLDELVTIEYIKMCEKYGIYPCWTLFGYLPLLENDGYRILDTVIKEPYDDAQDLLLWCFHQYEPLMFYPKLKEILKYWWEYDGPYAQISFSRGTGMISETKSLIKKYRNHGLDLDNYLLNLLGEKYYLNYFGEDRD